MKSPLNVTLKIIESIRSTNDIDQIIDSFVTLSHQIFPYLGCALYLLDEENNNFIKKKGVLFSELMEKEIRTMFDEGIIDWIIEYGDSKIIPTKLFNDKGCDLENKYVITPLMVGKRLIGVFIILAKLSDECVIPASLDNLFLLANQAAYVIENSMLYTDMDIKIKELEILFETGKAMSQMTNISSLLKLIISMTTGSIKTQKAVLYMINEEQELFPAAYIGFDSKDLKKRKINLGHGVTGWVAKEKQPLMINDYKNDMRFTHEHKIIDFEIENILSTPLCATKSKLVGVLTLYNRQNPTGFTDGDFRMVTALASYSGIAIERSTLYEKLKEGYIETMVALANAIEAKDPYTKGHTVRVTKYSLEIAVELKLGKKDMDIIRYAGILHDIGKIGISESILLKPEKLTDDEFNVIQKHAALGEEIIRSISFLKEAAPIVRHHHECLDGTGYPDGLKGEKISLKTRIMAVADAFDAMTTDRPYRPAMSIDVAIAELKKCSKTQFDYSVVNAWSSLLIRKKMLCENIDTNIDKIFGTHF